MKNITKPVSSGILNFRFLWGKQQLQRRCVLAKLLKRALCMGDESRRCQFGNELCRSCVVFPKPLSQSA
jgi:hypothetical protein